MSPKVSIIVPVYNVEKYIDKCINSILVQSFKNFELIMVNDGSTDRSGIICDVYVGKDSRLKVIHTENNGQATARNIGLHQAKGEFVGFVDSDDWIENNMFELLYNSCKKKNADISVVGVREVNEDGKCLSTYIPKDTNLQEVLKRAYPCNKLFKKELFIKNNLFFEEGRFYEDLELIPKLFIKCEKKTMVKVAAYNYLKRKCSTTSSRDEKILDNLWAYTKLRKFLLEENLYSIYREEFEMGVSHFRDYYIKILYDYPTRFLCKNSRKIISDFRKIGGLGIDKYLKLIFKHTNFKIRKLGYLFKNKILSRGLNN